MAKATELTGCGAATITASIISGGWRTAQLPGPDFIVSPDAGAWSTQAEKEMSTRA